MRWKEKALINIKIKRRHVIIDVTDTGKGISKKNITKVFKPGFTTKKRGWGLGFPFQKELLKNIIKDNYM